MTQTAVEWLIEQIREDQTIKAKSADEWADVFQEAQLRDRIHQLEGETDKQLKIIQYLTETLKCK